MASADHLGDGAVEVAPVPATAQPRADDREEPPEQALAAGAAPLEARGLDDQAGDELGVAAGEMHRHRAAHGVPDGDHRADAELADDRGDVVSGVLERERVG